MDQFQFDQADQDHLDKCVSAREQIARPRIGDFVHFPTGEVERFSHDWDEDLDRKSVV